ncbi:MAG: bifunctional phosphoribosylaminoimidazolecarboxamide formyltransferase/IMP cyclohydrolase [Nanoarchaeota archaeon]|nr:bifunctional phosphoribosylaminoimidazolecarboxamide formyltransferase/IMP cyclohydrolase [Nanoarchaeota archaeon]MBU1005211.1 bifunctional phosphoribosylaminoimidazolecarboxamide formyltransferase/IMP cyclohydrolase [Nanoarchaeota archaeon]MBU1946882.1 bifunctional phosphoribosylaminoimidazolecarboxamide formyltransferase/IMP cyclohydrolase [Nanoarchaeota archaeon]
MTIKRALISVFDKTGIVEFAKELDKLGIEILSTGGTAKALKDAGIKVKDVSDYTGFPEMMDGRVKTLHPKVHGGLLALRNNKEHMKQAKDNKIEMIDMVVVNLYPFAETVKKNLSFEETIEMIDIGGPSMIRSAAKNFHDVIVLTDPKDCSKILDKLKKQESISIEERKNLAKKVFEKTAAYDSMIAKYLETDEFPKDMIIPFEKLQNLRYGENPHQRGAFYKELMLNETSIVNAKQLWGKELSYNNIFDGDGALELVKEFKNPAVAIIKHANPCGVAERETIEKAFEDAYNVDPMSAFGCVIAMNRKCTMKIAEMTKGKFIELLIAPDFDKDALQFLKDNKKNCRILEVGRLTRSDKGYDMKKVVGGILLQSRRWPDIEKLELKCVTKRKPTKKELEDLRFAWKVNKHTKSNSVVFAKNKTGYGMGVGQMSRVDASIIAKRKSTGRANGGSMSSDAFFPFPDAVEAAAEAGIKSIIQPGGAKKDEEVIAKCNELGIAMVFSGVRLFKH